MTFQGGAFWEKQVGEPDTAYHAFCTYRGLGISRSLRRAAERFYAQREEPDGPQRDTEGTQNTAALRRFKEWSRNWMWVARAEAFDQEEAHERSLRLKERRHKMSEFHWQVGTLALQRVAEQLRLMGPGEPMPKSLAAVMNAAADLQRRSVGEPTSAVDVRSARPPEEDHDASWLDALSVEEKEELARLAGYLDDEEYGLPDDPEAETGL